MRHSLTHTLPIFFYTLQTTHTTYYHYTNSTHSHPPTFPSHHPPPHHPLSHLNQLPHPPLPLPHTPPHPPHPFPSHPPHLLPTLTALHPPPPTITPPLTHHPTHPPTPTPHPPPPPPPPPPPLIDRAETYTVIHRASAVCCHLIRTLANRRPSWDSIPYAPVPRPKHRYRSLPAADVYPCFLGRTRGRPGDR